MAPTLGKRKRITRSELEQPSRSASSSSGASQDSDGEDLQAIFRRAFEAKFKPIEVEPVNKKAKQLEVEDEDSDESEDSDWSGISSSSEPGVEVVEYADTQRAAEDKASKAEMRKFMSSKPPTSSKSLPSTTTKSTKPSKAEDDPLEASHLKNDQALQSLLRESTLLSAHAPTYSTRTSAAAVPSRDKLTDLHLQSLGAKSSIFKQKSMPMSHRKGIVAKGREREGKRRAEAKENGIILERERSEKKKVEKRERGVGGPSVGKFKGGTLMLSKKDVRSIERSGGGGGRGKSKGRGRGGKR